MNTSPPNIHPAARPRRGSSCGTQNVPAYASTPLTRKLLHTHFGQLFKFSVIAVAFFALLFVHILSYFLFSLSGMADVAVPSFSTSKITNTPGDPFIASTFSAYLHTPLFDSLPAAGNGIDATLLAFLKDHPELWKKRTYSEFVTLLVASYPHDPATVRTAFTGVTTALFSNPAPAGKRITLSIGNPAASSAETIQVNLGTINDLERQLRDQLTAEEALHLDESIIQEYQRAKDYEAFKAQHTSTVTLASPHQETITISMYTLQQHKDIRTT